MAEIKKNQSDTNKKNAQTVTYGKGQVPQSTKRPTPTKEEEQDAVSVLSGDMSQTHE